MPMLSFGMYHQFALALCAKLAAKVTKEFESSNSYIARRFSQELGVQLGPLRFSLQTLQLVCDK